MSYIQPQFGTALLIKSKVDERSQFHAEKIQNQMSLMHKPSEAISISPDKYPNQYKGILLLTNKELDEYKKQSEDQKDEFITKLLNSTELKISDLDANDEGNIYEGGDTYKQGSPFNR